MYLCRNHAAATCLYRKMLQQHVWEPKNFSEKQICNKHFSKQKHLGHITIGTNLGKVFSVFGRIKKLKLY